MSRFPEDLLIRAFSASELVNMGSSRQLYGVLRDFVYNSDVVGKQLTVPALYNTDFASIPRAVWNIIDPEDPVILYPSVVHDWLYTIGGKLPDGSTVTRDQADAVLLEGMADCGASRLQRFAVGTAVRTFGGSHWGT